MKFYGSSLKQSIWNHSRGCIRPSQNTICKYGVRHSGMKI